MAQKEDGKPETPAVAAGDPLTLEQRLAELTQSLLSASVERLRDYEAEHGPVTPAPPSARLHNRSSMAQIMGVAKRQLLDSGLYPDGVLHPQGD